MHDARNYCRPVLYIQSTQPYLYITVQIHNTENTFVLVCVFLSPGSVQGSYSSRSDVGVQQARASRAAQLGAAQCSSGQ